jgi:GxxExxY protein
MIMNVHEAIPHRDEEIAHRVIGAAIEVHRVLGPGFLEGIYQRALQHELASAGLRVESEKELLVPYKEVQLAGQRLDLLVEDRVIVELKTVEEFAPIHRAQLLSYLKSTNLRLGLHINFNVRVLKDGVVRLVR